MSALRRIFTAPGNPRVWISLLLYGSALVAIIVYRDRIGQKAAEKFTELTSPPAAKALGTATAESAAERVRRILRETPGERELHLLALVRSEDRKDAALVALRRLLDEGKDFTVTPALVLSARACVDEGKRAVRAVCASIVLASEKLLPDAKHANALVAALRERGAPPVAGGKLRKHSQRQEALRRLGLLGLVGARSRSAEKQALALLSATQVESRAEAARALGRIGDASFQAPLLRLVRDTTPAVVREGALAGLVDLGLAGTKRRSRVLRALAAALADKHVTGEQAEQTWQALRRLAANGRAESKMPAASDGAEGTPTGSGAPPPGPPGSAADGGLPSAPTPKRAPTATPLPAPSTSPLSPLIK